MHRRTVLKKLADSTGIVSTGTSPGFYRLLHDAKEALGITNTGNGKDPSVHPRAVNNAFANIQNLDRNNNKDKTGVPNASQSLDNRERDDDEEAVSDRGASTPSQYSTPRTSFSASPIHASTDEPATKGYVGVASDIPLAATAIRPTLTTGSQTPSIIDRSVAMETPSIPARLAAAVAITSGNAAPDERYIPQRPTSEKATGITPKSAGPTPKHGIGNQHLNNIKPAQAQHLSLYELIKKTMGLALTIFGAKKLANYITTNAISYSTSDLKLRDQAIPDWFDAFYTRTNEKQIIAGFLDKVLIMLNDTMYRLPYFEKMHVVLDIGCCSGDLHLKMAESFVRALPPSHTIKFIGVDKNTAGIKNIKAAFTSQESKYQSIESTIVEKNFFSNPTPIDYFSDILSNESNSDKADFIIVSHVAYYAPDVELFVRSVLNSLSHTGFAIFIHESETSIAKLINKRYNAPVKTQASKQIEEALADANANVYHATLHSEVPLPVGINEFIDYWRKKDSIDQSALGINRLEDLNITQDLLEFIFQIPFQVLKRKSLEASFIRDLEILSKAHNDKVVIESKIFFASLSPFNMSDAHKALYNFHYTGDPALIQGDYYQYLIPESIIQETSVSNEPIYSYLGIGLCATIGYLFFNNIPGAAAGAVIGIAYQHWE